MEMGNITGIRISFCFMKDKITEQFRPEETSEGHLFQASAESKTYCKVGCSVEARWDISVSHLVEFLISTMMGITSLNLFLSVTCSSFFLFILHRSHFNLSMTFLHRSVPNQRQYYRCSVWSAEEGKNCSPQIDSYALTNTVQCEVSLPPQEHMFNMPTRTLSPFQ